MELKSFDYFVQVPDKNVRYTVHDLGLALRKFKSLCRSNKYVELWCEGKIIALQDD